MAHVRTLALTTFLMIGAGGSASAEPPDKYGFDAATKSAIQGVITRQLDAFEHGNAQAAEDFAAPGIKDKFPEPSKFLDMVKQNYSALIHPKSTTFGEIAPSPHGPLQKMTIVASDGTVWTAIYSFEQVGGEWRITGCGMAKSEDEQAI